MYTMGLTTPLFLLLAAGLSSLQLKVASDCSICSSPTYGENNRETRTDIHRISEAALFSPKKGMPQKVRQIPGGEYLMGTNDPWFPEDGEGPERKIILSDFEMDAFEISNFHFLEFVLDTDYITEAEVFGWSFVLENLVSEDTNSKIEEAVADAEWWLPVQGANWKYPEGPDMSDVFSSDRQNHPVVHVSYQDAVEFCKWRDMRLPTEAEWEVAARGGKTGRLFPWGNLLLVKGKHMCNIWQGEFPQGNTLEDGYLATSPIGSFNPNGYGLYDMSGNVWEWVSDWYSPQIGRLQSHMKSTITDPTGPESGTDRVHKGGSYMCHKETCYRYRIVARGHSSPDSAATNVGFRCSKSVSI